MAEKKSVSAREVIADIRVGMTDDQLMKKHLLSAKGLQSLKNKLLATGLLTQAELEGKMLSGKVTIPPVDKKAFARNIANAVKTGMSDVEIMKKFGLSAQKLPAVFTSLTKAGYLSQDDLDKRPGGFEQTVDLTSEKVFTDPRSGHSEIATPIPPESAKDVLLELAKRFNVPREDLERLKTASITDIKAFLNKHNIPWAEGVELAMALGLQAGDFLFEATDKIMKGAGTLLSAAKDKIESRKGVVSKATGQFKSSGQDGAPPSDETATPEDSSQPNETVAQSPTSQDQAENRAVLKCPNCRMPQNKPFEVCPQCGVVVEKFLRRLENEQANAAAEKKIWYERSWLIILLIALIPPIGIYGIIRSSQFKRKTKAIVIGIAASIMVTAVLLPSKQIEKVSSVNQPAASLQDAPAIEEALPPQEPSPPFPIKFTMDDSPKSKEFFLKFVRYCVIGQNELLRNFPEEIISSVGAKDTDRLTPLDIIEALTNEMPCEGVWSYARKTFSVQIWNCLTERYRSKTANLKSTTYTTWEKQLFESGLLRDPVHPFSPACIDSLKEFLVFCPQNIRGHPSAVIADR